MVGDGRPPGCTDRERLCIFVYWDVGMFTLRGSGVAERFRAASDFTALRKRYLGPHFQKKASQRQGSKESGFVTTATSFLHLAAACAKCHHNARRAP